jgi:predicted ATPase/class 3 adenylate cyclase
LFTDIEGSTKLWSDDPVLMPAALAKHDDLIITAVTAASGEVFKHTGDGLCAVFASAADAVTAAACAQRSLTGAEWGDIGRLRVRMAVHAGDAEPRGDDWSGPALNRTARIMSLANGGQVLLSSSAYELASDALDADVSVLDLGSHSLRGLARPEHIWQLAGEGLERTFPPLRSVDNTPGWLPSQLTSFVGRTDELELIAGHIRSNRLVTLVGPGGVGKTRLAAEVGHRIVDKFPDGVWLFELAGLTTAAGLEALVMATIGLSGASAVPPRQALLGVIRSWRALLIVDNCEHISEGAADLIHAMLAAAPDLVILATSRERLRVPGERVVAIDPLPIGPDGSAVQLFLERATAIQPIAETDLDIGAIADVCRSLDGLPLAIELAAARTVSMTPAEIERRLDQRFRLLAEPHATEDRHGSLQRVLDWSFDLLTPECQTFFARLSLLAGSFDTAAAHAVAWPDDEFTTLDMLGELVAKSLLGANPNHGHTSYRMLETMRQYGAQRLPESDALAVRTRHGEHFAALAESAWEGCRGEDSQAWLDLIDEEFDDVRAAFDWAVAIENADVALRIAAGLFMYNQTRRLQALYDWVDRALALPGIINHRLRHAALLHRAYGHLMRGQAAAAKDDLACVLDAVGDDAALGLLARCWLTVALHNTGNIAGSSALAKDVLTRTEHLDDAFDYDRAEALWNWCSLAMGTSAPDRPRAMELLALARRLGNPRAIAGGLIMAAVADPDPVRGAALLVEARDVTARSLDNYRNVLAGGILGAFESEADPAAGLTVLREVVRQARRTGFELLLLQIPRAYFGAFAALGRYETIAVLDGVAVMTAIHAAVTVAAIDTARDALGADRYDELKRQGTTMTIDDVAAFLLTAVADL